MKIAGDCVRYMGGAEGVMAVLASLAWPAMIASMASEISGKVHEL